jgi:hypothetical protein
MEPIDNNKFLSVADEVLVEVGDVKQPDFYPQAKLICWENESNFSLRYAADIAGATAGMDEQGRVVWTAADGTEVHVYADPDPSMGQGLELEVVYQNKPASNVVGFTIQHKEVEFLYQPPLTAEEIERGARRPENVIGSYAVYHASKTGNAYQSGKMFHIYRPKAVASDGEGVWCELNIDPIANTLTVTVPQDFLDSAAYPVTVDPTFGYTTAGASSQYLSSMESGVFQTVNYYAAATASTVISNMQAYLNPPNSSTRAKGTLYEGTTPPSALIAAGAGDSTPLSTGAGWKTLDFTTSPPSVVSGSSYRLGVLGDTDGLLAYYDSGSAPNAANFNSTGVNFTVPEPWPSTGNHNLGRFSIYVNYTTASTVPVKMDNYQRRHQ